MILLRYFLRQFVTVGRLVVIDADGKQHVFKGRDIPPTADVARRSNGQVLKPDITIRFHDKAITRAIAVNPTLRFGEAIMDGKVTVENASVRDAVDFLAANTAAVSAPAISGPARLANYLLRRFHQFNPAQRAKRNAAHHYNISGDLYALFLDADRQYSCAYFDHDGVSLDDAQIAKKRHIAAKLHLRPGLRVLDIGCGWGGLSLYLVDRF